MSGGVSSDQSLSQQRTPSPSADRRATSEEHMLRDVPSADNGRVLGSTVPDQVLVQRVLRRIDDPSDATNRPIGEHIDVDSLSRLRQLSLRQRNLSQSTLIRTTVISNSGQQYSRLEPLPFSSFFTLWWLLASSCYTIFLVHNGNITFLVKTCT